jgi:hypothetical protein
MQHGITAPQPPLPPSRLDGGEKNIVSTSQFGSIEQNIVFANLVSISVKQSQYTDKKENKIFLIYKEIQSGAFCKVIYEEGLPNILYEEMRKYFPIYEEAVSHI